jgi:ketosteroid isomerase-like protein
MSQENMKIVRRVLEAAQAGDDERVLADFHEEIEMHEPHELPGASVRRGHNGYREGRVRLEETFREIAYEPEEFIDAGQRVLVAVRYRGRARYSDLPVDLLVYWLYAFRADKVIRVDVFFDRVTALEAAGMSE